MGKWNNKPQQTISEQFLQNEERRKQMIIEAAKRRKEKEKKLQEAEIKQRKNQQQALIKHKQQKKDAYVKYLRSNMHDKYQDIKRQKKQQETQIKPVSKWKKKTAEKQDNQQQLQALDLDVKFTQNKEESNVKAQSSVGKEKRKIIAEQFEKQWEFQQNQKDELLSSKLLDSLDLDLGTLNREKDVKRFINSNPKKDEINELRDIIGYESTVFQKQQKSKQQQKNMISKNKHQSKPELNEVEVFNELKRKKESKILHWAISEQIQAEDLFSNCSSKKTQPKALKQINEELKNAKKNRQMKKADHLTTIREEKQRMNSKQKIKTTHQIERQKSKQVLKNRSYDKKNNTASQFPQQKQKAQKNKTANNFQQKRNQIKMRSTSQTKSRQKSKQKDQRQYKANQKVKQQVKTQTKAAQQPKKLFGNLPPLPAKVQYNNSIATHDMRIDVQSFIKQDLINLNEEEYKIQMQLRQFHKNHKENIRQIYNKYQIKADYKTSSEITGQPRPKQTIYKDEDNIQQSIQNLDNLLIRREINSKETFQTKNQSERQVSNSIINPFSNSEDLCNQILKLAKNVATFDKKPEIEDQNGYGYMNKMKKNTSHNKSCENKGNKQKQQEEEQLSESQQVSQFHQNKISRPPAIYDPSQTSSKRSNQMLPRKQEKIHVNTALLKGLLDDD